MSVETIHETLGIYKVSKNVSVDELKNLETNPNISHIQCSHPLNSKDIDNLEEYIFSKRPDVTFRIYENIGERYLWDLTFLRQLPSLKSFSINCVNDAKNLDTLHIVERLEHLSIGISNLESFDFLKEVTLNLTSLSLDSTKSQKPKIDFISRFKNLEYLYLEKQQKGIESINHLKKLQEIVLRSISTENLDYLIGLNDLWSVDIKLGGIKNFDALKKLPTIKYLELWLIRNLSDISFISELTSLQYLSLQSLKNVTKLPSLEKLKNLRRLCLETMRGLTDLSSLKNASKLEEFIYIAADNQEPENLLPVLENPTIQNFWVGFGSDKKNLLFDDLLKHYGKQKGYSHEFQYQ